MIYEGFATTRSSMTDEASFVERLNSLPKFVVSTALDEVEWNKGRLIEDNVAEQVSKLKQQPGQDILIHSSDNLLYTRLCNTTSSMSLGSGSILPF